MKKPSKRKAREWYLTRHCSIVERNSFYYIVHTTRGEAKEINVKRRRIIKVREVLPRKRK